MGGLVGRRQRKLGIRCRDWGREQVSLPLHPYPQVAQDIEFHAGSHFTVDISDARGGQQ